jgi:hypothetical protein
VSRKPLLGLALCAGLALTGLVALPSQAAAPDAGVQPALYCSATVKPVGVAKVGYTNGADDLVAKKGAKVTFKITVKQKACNGQTVKLAVGKKTVATAKFKNKKATIKLPAKYAKKVGKNALKFTFIKSTLKYNLYFTSGALSTDAANYTIYVDNEIPVTTSVNWKGPFNGPELVFYQGSFPTGYTTEAITKYAAASSTKNAYVGTETWWLGAGAGEKIFKGVGTYNVNLAFSASSVYTAANLTTKLTFTVLPNTFSAASGNMLAPGTYTFPVGQYGSCSVEVAGSPTNSDGTTRYGSEYFTAGTNPVTTVVIQAADTSVTFKYCGGGPTKIA